MATGAIWPCVQYGHMCSSLEAAASARADELAAAVREVESQTRAVSKERKSMASLEKDYRKINML